MHVLLICRSFPHHRSGGLEWTSQDLLEGLIAAGHRVSVVTTPMPKVPALRRLEPNGELIHYGRRPAAYDPAFFIELRRTLAKDFQRIGADVIHAQGFAGLAIPRDLPLLTTIHGTLWSETPLRRGSGQKPGWALHWRFKHRHALAPLWKAFLRRQPLLSVDSAFSRNELEAEVGFPMARAHVVPLGFDLCRFPLVARNEARRALGIPESAFLLFGVGRLEPIKKPSWLLEGFAAHATSHPELRLIIGGEGPERAQLRERAGQFGERAQLPGLIPADRLPLYLAAADLFLNADHGSPAFGLSNAESLVMGTPVLATDSGAHREVVLEGDGAIVPAEAVTQWRDQLGAIVSKGPEPEATRLARVHRARARFDRAAMVYQYSNLYATLR